MDNLNQSAELLCTMSPRIRHKLKPGEKQFRRGASILALKKNIRRTSLYDQSIQIIDNNDLNIESTTSTESCDSEKWKLNILNKSPIVISDSESDFEKESMNKYEQDANNLQNYPLPNDKVDDIECWIEKVNAANENKDTTVYTEVSTICGSETGENFLPKERGPVVNSTFVSKDCKRFDELFRPRNLDLRVSSNSLQSDDNEEVNKPSENVIIEDSFHFQNESLTTRVKKNMLSSNESRVHDKNNSSRTSPKTPVGEGEDLEVMLDKLYGRSWREKQELILPKTEPRKNTAKTKASNLYSERKPRKAESSKSNNLQKWQNVRLATKEKSSLCTKLKALFDSDTNSESSPIEVYPKTRLKFDDSSDELTNDSKTSEYFRTKKDTRKYNSPKQNNDISSLGQSSVERIRKDLDNMKDLPNKYKIKDKNPVSLRKNIEKSSLYTKLKALCDSDTNSESSPIEVYPKTRLKFDDSSDELTNDSKKSEYFRTKEDTHTNSPKENNDISGLGQSSAERIRKDLDNMKGLPNKYKIKDKNPATPRKNTISNKENTPNKTPVQPKSLRINRTSHSSSTSNSDAETSTTKFVTKRIVNKPIANGNVSISSDDEWDQEISKIHRKSELCNGTYSFLASLSGDIPVSKCDMSARIYRNNFKTFKNQLLSKLFKMYNERVFDNVLAPDMLLEWNDRMTGTAGYCYCKKITRKSGLVERSARVVLSTKVIDSAQRMRDTLIHELCHAATWIVNCVSDGHGPYWKTWAHKAMICFPELPPIKRCHDYVINTKYTYKCTGCGYSIGRHTKSLDVERKRCGHCHGKFEVLINKTTKKGETKMVPATPKKEATGFALFVKENYGVHKTPNLKHGEVMKLLGQKFQKMKVNQT